MSGGGFDWNSDIKSPVEEEDHEVKPRVVVKPGAPVDLATTAGMKSRLRGLTTHDNDYRLDALLDKAGKALATDLYLAAGAVPAMTINGKLVELGSERLTPEDTQRLAGEAMSPDQMAVFKKQLATNLAYRSDSGRFRFNIYHQRGTVAMVARLIRQEILTIGELGLPGQLETVVMEERGIVLITGATGSGKSTTLAAMIDYRNKNGSGHIVTIEDPIEFLYEHNNCIVSQREVGIDTYSFEEALKDALRQAPKVILIGEIRDAETAKFALHASDTGHLVLATLHTNNTSQTLERLLNLFPHDAERQMLLQLSLNLRAIICQRLVPSKDGGRACAVELLLNSPRIQQLIQQGNIPEIRNTIARSELDGMQTFDKALLDLVQEGIVDAETALKFADSANDLKLRLGGMTNL